MLENMYFEETTEFEEPAYIKGYNIFERVLCVYLKVGDSPNLSSISYSFKILNFPWGKPAIGDIECKSFNNLDLSNPSVIRHPNIPFTDERLIINIPKEREFIRFCKLNTPGLDIESNVYDPELFIINNRDIKDIVLPAPITEKSEPIIDKVNDEILEYRKEIAELNEDIRCLLRIIKKYGMEDF